MTHKIIQSTAPDIQGKAIHTLLVRLKNSKEFFAFRFDNIHSLSKFRMWCAQNHDVAEIKTQQQERIFGGSRFAQREIEKLASEQRANLVQPSTCKTQHDSVTPYRIQEDEVGRQYAACVYCGENLHL